MNMFRLSPPLRNLPLLTSFSAGRYHQAESLGHGGRTAPEQGRRLFVYNVYLSLVLQFCLFYI